MYRIIDEICNNRLVARTDDSIAIVCLDDDRLINSKSICCISCIGRILDNNRAIIHRQRAQQKHRTAIQICCIFVVYNRFARLIYNTEEPIMLNDEIIVLRIRDYIFIRNRQAVISIKIFAFSLLQAVNRVCDILLNRIIDKVGHNSLIAWTDDSIASLCANYDR